MVKLYDEEISRKISPPPHDPENKEACDIYYLRVRLFRSDIRDARIVGADEWTIYLLSEEYRSFVGDPAVERGCKEHSRTRSYVTGTDSERIRQAISIIDGFAVPTGETK